MGWSLSRSRWEWCLRLELAAVAHGYKERERKPVGLRFYHVSFDPLQVFIRRRTGNPSNYCGSRESSRVGWAVALQGAHQVEAIFPGEKGLLPGFGSSDALPCSSLATGTSSPPCVRPS